MPAKPTRKQRRPGDLPANWQWRDGRPRWIPAPGLRQAGWKGHDLKADDGSWLGRGASIDRAALVNDAVAAWRAGGLVPAELAAVAPPGAVESPTLTRTQRLDRRSIGWLIDAYAGDNARKLAASEEFQRLGVKTQAEYRSKLKRLVDVLAGYVALPARDAPPAERAAYEAARAKIRGSSIDMLEPPPYGDPARPLLYVAYHQMRKKVGHHMANGTLRVASAWLDWCVTVERAARLNPAKLVDMQAPPGRLRVASWDELRALVDAADKLGLPSIGDAVILGVDLSWNQGDRLALTWAQVGDEHRIKGTRKKTNAVGETRLLPQLGVPRLQAIRARQKALYGANVAPTHILICEDTGAPWKSDWYRHRFADVRAEAAKACPSVATLTDQDLRDTAVTIAYEAELTEQEIASRTLHSLKRIREILDTHYGKITRQVGDNGAKKLERYLGKKGMRL